MIRNTIKRLKSITVDVMKSMKNVLMKWYEDMMIDEQSFRLKKEEVRYWKNQMFYIILTVVLIIGAPLLFYGSYMFYRNGEIGYSIVQILFYIIAATILLNRRLSINFKKHFLVLMIFTVSLFLIFTASILGSGMIGVTFTLILSGCLLDKKQIRNFLIINYIVFFLITVLLFGGQLDGIAIENYKEVWWINAGTAQCCGLVLLILINVIYHGLEKQTQIIKKSQAIIEASEIKHKEMIKNSIDVILIMNSLGLITYHSPNLHERFPWMSKDIFDHLFIEEFHPEDREYFTEILEELLKQPSRKEAIELRYIKGDEIGYIEMTAVNLLEDENIKGILINCRDITERRMREEEIMYLYQHDHLTGLYNRASHEIELQRLDHNRYYPLSIIVGDINGLKMINDSLGHVEGDKLLISMARILRSCCREVDIVTRLGGDEFIIVMPNSNEEEALKVIQKIYDICDEYNRELSGEIYHISISLGAATKMDIDADINNVIKQAEDSMYKRKLLEGRSYHSSVIASMKSALFEKSYETEQHARRLIQLSKMLGEAIGLTSQQFDELELLSTLHDIGKIGVDDQILNKPAKLTEEEWVQMKKHSEIGYRIAMSSPELMSIAYYILTHHEHWDGGGYPQGLSEERIPLLSRILSVVDSYDAMTEDRPYRRGMSKQDAIAEILAHVGTQFDPQIAKLFVTLMSSVNKEFS